MTSPQTIAIAAIDEDRKYWRMVIRAIGEDPLRIKPGNLKWLIARGFPSRSSRRKPERLRGSSRAPRCMPRAVYP